MQFVEQISVLPWYKKLKILRIINNLKQKEVADKCGVDKRVYWTWENGVNIPIKQNREAISHIYGVSVAEIFDIYREN